MEVVVPAVVEKCELAAVEVKLLEVVFGRLMRGAEKRIAETATTIMISATKTPRLVDIVESCLPWIFGGPRCGFG
jgi:hypothetical protein